MSSRDLGVPMGLGCAGRRRVTDRVPRKMVRVVLAALAVVAAILPAPGRLLAAPPAVGLVYNASQSADLRAGIDRLESYRRAVEENGGRVSFLLVTDSSALTSLRLKYLDALLLPGGCDVHPAVYGEQPHPALERTDLALDVFKAALLEWAFARRLPVLGICRGHQFLNVFRGGSLYQDLPAQHPAGPRLLAHRRRTAKGSNAFCAHEVVVASETHLAALIGAGIHEVNSYHHQAVKAVGHGVRVTATAPDGVVEASEVPAMPFCLGVQWHPERQRQTQPVMNRLFAALIAAAENRRRAVAKGF
jgi:putative glutamine amidotransferase